MKLALMSLGCFCHCRAVLTQNQGIFCFSSRQTSEEVRSAQAVERSHPTDPNLPELGEEGGRRDIWSYVISLPKLL